MKKLLKYSLAVLLAFFLLCHAFSRELALALSGFDTLHTQLVIHETDYEDNEYQVLRTSSGDAPALVMLRKGFLGFWYVEMSDTASDLLPHWASLGWMKDSGFYSHPDSRPQSTLAWHIVCCGDNAAKPIRFETDQIPRNTTVNVTQQDNLFCIHIISYADPEVFSSFSPYELLIENGCLETPA